MGVSLESILVSKVLVISIAMVAFNEHLFKSFVQTSWHTLRALMNKLKFLIQKKKRKSMCLKVSGRFNEYNLSLL